MPAMAKILFSAFFTLFIISCSAKTQKSVVKSFLEQDAKQYIDRVIPEIVANWEFEKVIDHISAADKKYLQNGVIENVFFNASTLGPLDRYHGSKGGITVFENTQGEHYISGQFVASAKFKNGSADIYVALQREKGFWKIHGISVNPIQPALQNSSRTTSEKKPQTKAELEDIIAKLPEDNILKFDKYSSEIFSLASIYEREGNHEKAIHLYQKGLLGSPAKLEYHLALAKLLLKKGQEEKAANRLHKIIAFAEREELYKEAENILVATGIPIPEPAAQDPEHNHVEIVLLPVGSPNMRILQELRAALQTEMKIPVSIANSGISLGTADRKWADRYVDDLFERTKASLAGLQFDQVIEEAGLNHEELATFEGKKHFLHTYFSKMGAQGRIAQLRFEEELQLMGNQGQYRISRINQNIRLAFPFEKRPKVKGYIGVTEKDVYRKGSNYLFGGTKGGYGVISYYRFTAEFNGENDNRPRLVARLLRQALSSGNFVLGIPRCDTPLCARAYPKNVTEQDAKSEKLCEICRTRLNEYLQDPRSHAAAWEYWNAGMTYYQKEEYDRAIELFKKILTEDPKSVSAYLNLGHAYNEKGLFDLTADHYKTALNLIEDPKAINDFGSIYFFLGNYYLGKNENRKAKNWFQKLLDEDKGREATAYRGLGLASKKEAEFDKAIQYFSKSIKIDQNNIETYELFGQTYFAIKDYKNARENFLKAISINPERSKNHYYLGLILLDSGEEKEAIRRFERAKNISPSFFEAHLKLGVIYGNRNLLDKAMEEFQIAAQIHPQNADAWNNIGYTFYLKQKFEKAIANYKKSLNISPRYGLYHYNLALSYFEMEDFQQAIRALDRAREFGYPGSAQFRKKLERYR